MLSVTTMVKITSLKIWQLFGRVPLCQESGASLCLHYCVPSVPWVRCYPQVCLSAPPSSSYAALTLALPVQDPPFAQLDYVENSPILELC